MKFKHYSLLVAFTVGFVTTTYSQHTTFAIKNGFAVLGGISQYDIITDNFTTKSRLGWVGGLSSTVDIPNEWYNVSYGMQVSENNLEISGRAIRDVEGNEMIEYKLMAVQLGFTYHAKVINNIVTIDFGPQLQYNGKLELKDKTKEGYFINGYDNLTAEEIVDISQFNVNGMAGISAGIGSFRIKAQYIYGFLNILNKLNDKNFNVGSATEKFKGNQSMLVFAVMFSF
jgi:hypothetical protein